MADQDRARWDERYRALADDAGAPPASFLTALADRLPFPRSGVPPPRALDVAGGAGRNALWLAGRGFEVTLADVSPVGLARARVRAQAAGVPLHLVEVDLEAGPLPAGPFDLIVQIDFLHRPLFATFPAALAPGGLLVVSHPTRRNLERHAHPGERFLLDDQRELRALAGGLEILCCEEGWCDDRHTARLLARRP